MTFTIHGTMAQPRSTQGQANLPELEPSSLAMGLGHTQFTFALILNTLSCEILDPGLMMWPGQVKTQFRSKARVLEEHFTRFKSPGGDGTITVRVGVSFMSITQACSNAETEQPDLDFEGTVAAAKTAWKEKMDVVSLDATGVPTALQTVFWSGIYRTMISPQDYTGENPLWESDEPYYDSFFW
jgi:hypothetical protein